MIEDLNLIPVHADGMRMPHDRLRPDVVSSDGGIDVFFQNLEARLIEQIMRWPVVVGCVAWLTNEPILAALATREATSIIIQKEDFLRPDSGDWAAGKLRRSYALLRGFDIYQSRAFYNYCGDPSRESVRCVGVCVDRKKTPPRMHHKFLVFCDYAPHDEVGDYGDAYMPRVVWTGSFNATHNGTRSLENAAVIRNEGIATGYYNEWLHVLGLSESLDWRSPYVCPDYRLGT